MDKQTEKIDAFETQVNAKLATLGTALDTIASAQANIAADEKTLLAEVAAAVAPDLTPDNQAKLDGVLTRFTAKVDAAVAAAANLQALADSLPDAPVVEPGANPIEP
jgi:outer membrane scaffolding protein for murein synthesis (MipA/OmpV family)